MIDTQKKKRGAKKGSTHTVGIKLSELTAICEAISKIKKENGLSDGDVVVPVGRKWMDVCASAIGQHWLNQHVSNGTPDNLQKCAAKAKKESGENILFKVYNDGI